MSGQIQEYPVPYAVILIGPFADFDITLQLAMILTGLTSITFRKLVPRQVVDLVAAAGLNAIEWGGDIHVPHGDIVRADEVRRMTIEAGLSCSSYGSYYVIGQANTVPFEAVIETALALAAPVIRVWPGRCGQLSAVTAGYRLSVADEARRLTGMAAQAGILLASEFHGGSLTETAESAAQMLAEINHPNFKTYWQPYVGATIGVQKASLSLILPQVVNLHVFHWGAKYERLPLADGVERWREFMGLAGMTGRDHHALIEFVRDDAPDAFQADAAILKKLAAEINAGRSAQQ